MQSKEVHCGGEMERAVFMGSEIPQMLISDNISVKLSEVKVIAACRNGCCRISDHIHLS